METTANPVLRESEILKTNWLEKPPFFGMQTERREI
jgi:hypothetical protein